MNVSQMNALHKTDIIAEGDISNLVHTFYTKVRKDDFLAPVFNEIIKEDEWEHHLGIMCDFWSTMLLYSRKYLKDPMTKHLVLPLTQKHFERWLALFTETVDELFVGKVANDAKIRANNIARIMQAVIEKKRT